MLETTRELQEDRMASMDAVGVVTRKRIFLVTEPGPPRPKEELLAIFVALPESVVYGRGKPWVMEDGTVDPGCVVADYAVGEPIAGELHTDYRVTVEYRNA